MMDSASPDPPSPARDDSGAMTRWQSLRIGLLTTLIVVVAVCGWLLPERRSPMPLASFAESGFVVTGSPSPDWKQEMVLDGERSWITHVQVIDVDGDGRNEILACDAGANRLVTCRRVDGAWKTSTHTGDLLAPAHATPIDLDGDGDRDLVVSILGNIQPDDSVVGQVVWLEQTDSGTRRHVILEGVRRVADAQPGDFDGDGDVDLAVAVFGYARGEVLWLENDGDQHFTPHRLLSAPGAIHVPVVDLDGDGDLDIATVVSQDEEEVWGFENLGDDSGERRFRGRRLWYTHNHDLGSAGLIATDIDRDGDVDLLLPTGDNFEYRHTYPQPYHGCQLLQNGGGWSWSTRTLVQFGGTYAAAVCQRGVVLVSMFNAWREPEAASVVLATTRGDMAKPWPVEVLATSPSHLATVACGDLDGDGREDIVVGSLRVAPPLDRPGRIAVFLDRYDSESAADPQPTKPVGLEGTGDSR